ncbi:MAG: leucine--tRNA ligase [Alphaproteobacteria bacterium]|nr:MAG: leucine--tRNA ligase [Alphaproteobacteria bacterium]
MDISHINLIETNIKNLWKVADLYRTEVNSKTPYSILDFFPHPSGIGLHVGHTVGYIATDIFARFKRANGYNVLYAMGFDSFGLPAEQFAIQTNQHPEITTHNNINNMLSQLECLSLSHDPSRSFSTTDTDYYKWTQWIFLKIYNSYFNNLTGKAEPIENLYSKLKSKKYTIEDGLLIELENNYSEEEINQLVNSMRLAYLNDVEVNWCPMLGTVLANEEIKNGKSERGNHPVEKRKMKQWMMGITAYADRLYNQLDTLDWPTNIVSMQKNWIGKSEGALITFHSKTGKQYKIFTTKPETLFGVTFIAVANQEDQVEKQIDEVIHPITKETIPVWTANYVIGDYGTGTLMAVPAHDQRDFEFAKQHNINFKPVVRPNYAWLVENALESMPQSQLLNHWKTDPTKFKSAYEGTGPLITPQQFEIFEDISVKNQKKQVRNFIEQKKIGKYVTQHKLRDWLFSRQRYWGEPFPIVFDKAGNAYPIDENQLPVELPQQYDFKPELNQQSPRPPLEKASNWKTVQGIILDNGSVKILNQNEINTYPTNMVQTFTRELNTMPNWAGSCWYYLRYMDPKNDSTFVSKEKLEYWAKDKIGTIDLYVGGAEHAVLHLLYARFWHMVLFDLGYLINPEPFTKLLNPGMMTADAYMDERGVYVDVEDVVVKNQTAIQISTGKPLTIEPGKMGKRYKNGIDPKDMCAKYGVDVFRMHVMYISPVTQSSTWNANIKGMQRFYNSIHQKLQDCIDIEYSKTDDTSQLHKTILSVTEEIVNFRFNTAIAALIKLNNSVEKFSMNDCVIILQLLYPFAPHLAEHLYQQIRSKMNNLPQLIEHLQWPTYDPKLIVETKIKLPVNIDGKIRDVLEIDINTTDDEIKILILQNTKIQKYLQQSYSLQIIRKDKPIIANVTTT